MKPGIILSAIFFSIAIGCTDSPRIVAPVQQTPDGSTDSDATPRSVVKLTDSAVAKFKDFLAGGTSSYVRLSIKGDGVTGFSYDLQIDDAPLQPTDFIDDSYGFPLAVDKRSSLYVDGATIDWVTKADGREGFQFDNPNATKE